MAEFVQYGLEQMIPELEQLQRVELFSKEEVKLILMRRKRFEYKIQKQTKRKEDFLAYIQYEINLLALIKIRRQKIGYHYKKKEIDFNIISRIMKQFRILQHRFPQDPKVWISNIEFQKQMKMFSQVGKTFRRFLQVHTGDVEIWISAAKFEMQYGQHKDDFGNARNIMLEALRFHPKSDKLFREYFRLELLHAESLRKKSFILCDTKKNDEIDDPIMKGAVAMTVFLQACSNLNDPSFVSSLLGVALTFDFAKIDLCTSIVEYLLDNYPAHWITYDTRARYALVSNSDIDGLSRLQTACSIYDEALSSLEDSNGNAFAAYFDTLIELPALLSPIDEGVKNCDKFLANIYERVMSLLRLGDERGLLKETHYLHWLTLLTNDESTTAVLESALRNLPSSVAIWRRYFGLNKMSKFIFDRFINCCCSALKQTDDSSLPALWVSILDDVWAIDAEWTINVPDQLLSKSMHEFPLVVPALRIRYLELLAKDKGIDETRSYFEKTFFVPPFSLDFHLTMLRIEQEIKHHAVDPIRIRHILESACQLFGHDNIDIWLTYLKFERSLGNASNFGAISSRAEKILAAHVNKNAKNSSLKEDFILLKETI